MSFSVTRTAETVEFRSGNTACGIYHYTDPYKSFFRGLFTPSGHDVVGYASDHPHHKGLQFGLTTDKANFWEEDEASEPNTRKLPIGKQETTKLELLSPADGVGFTQEILWKVGEEPIFNETRTISLTEDNGKYVWAWHMTLTAAWKDVEITNSVWAVPPYCVQTKDYGYCGLGLRLAREYFQNSEVLPADVTCGSTSNWVAFKGQGAQVRFDQIAVPLNALFVSTYDGRPPYGPGGPGFAFMGLVPIPGVLKQGHSLDYHYVITVSDG
jgi:hypothetical protein